MYIYILYPLYNVYHEYSHCHFWRFFWWCLYHRILSFFNTFKSDLFYQNIGDLWRFGIRNFLKYSFNITIPKCHFCVFLNIYAVKCHCFEIKYRFWKLPKSIKTSDTYITKIFIFDDFFDDVYIIDFHHFSTLSNLIYFIKTSVIYEGLGSEIS